VIKACLGTKQGRGQRVGEMTQIIYAHMNKKIFKNTLK
jgi:hypothetical protein